MEEPTSVPFILGPDSLSRRVIVTGGFFSTQGRVYERVSVLLRPRGENARRLTTRQGKSG